MIRAFIVSSIEYQKWGMNIETISAIGAIILTVVQGWGFIKQAQAIWHEQSGDSIPVWMFGYLWCYFGSLIVYSFSARSAVMFINGLLFIGIAPVVIGLMKFKRHTVLERGCYPLFGVIRLDGLKRP